MAEDYNGWKNRQTWNVMLWLNNDERAYLYYQERVKLFKAHKPGRKMRGFTAQSIARNAIGDQTPDGISLIGRRVDWPAIASAMMEE